MLLEIKKVNQCRNKAYGNFMILGHQRARITISMKKNPTLGEYAATLLHEMLHCYTTLLRVDGFRVTNRGEHQRIEACEAAIIDEMHKYLKRRA